MLGSHGPIMRMACMSHIQCQVDPASILGKCAAARNVAAVLLSEVLMH